MSVEPGYVHLRLHSEYSLLEGAVRIGRLAALCHEHAMPAIAVTDTNNLFAALEFSETVSAEGIQPIIGCQLDVGEAEPRPGERPSEAAPLVFLAQNIQGYRNLLKLNTCAHLGRDGAPAHVLLNEIERHADGLICLTGGPDGPVGRHLRAGHRDRAEALMERLHAAFGDRLYVELQRHPGSDGPLGAAEAATEGGLIEIAYAMGLGLVATNDVHFPARDMFEAHDALLCIADGTYVDQQEPRRHLTPEHYFKSPAEMAALFADLPEAIANTVEIARRCAFKVEKHAPILPRFADDEVDELRRQAREGLERRLASIQPAASPDEYTARLEFELGVIEKMGFPGYFLIVADFIKWAKDHDIPVGPGRGSGAGSLVAYALTITDLDPLRYSLLFERFLNPERVSMPDFDIDFCMDRREEVIAYVQQKYGTERVAQIITFGALLSKAAVRDVGRVLQIPYGQVDRLSKLIPVDGVKPVPIKQALEEEPQLRAAARAEEVVERLLTYGQRLEGLLRNASTHAAGVVIGDRPLDELVPLYKDPRSEMPATQFNMKWVEQAGLVKYDFLGLKTLTVIKNAVDLVKLRGVDVDISQIDMEDKATFELYASARTVAVFQVESTGMMDALRRMKPTTIEDIVALVALYRPGPMENIPKYCEVKNGVSGRVHIHPSIDHLLDETQGIIVYQEQVMQIAQEMAGYTLGGADVLRRAMGKKNKVEMDSERPKFMAGAAANGVDADKAREVWLLLEKFANYGFNKSHAAAYGVVSYQTAWLKANHPVEFMAAVMNCDIHLTDKLNVYKREVDRLGIALVAPCVNRSEATFTVRGGAVVYALGGLKNVGVEAMRLIVAARGERPFRDLFDFAERVEMKRIGKRSLEMLARAGAFDVFDRSRARVFGALDALVAYSATVHEEAASAQVSLFGEGSVALPRPRLPEAEEWLPAARLEAEHQAIGFYLSGHPLDDYMPALRRKGVRTIEEVRAQAAHSVTVARIAGSVASRREQKSARGNRFAFVQLSDPSGLYEVAVFSDILETSRAMLEAGANVVLSVEATLEAGQLKLKTRGLQPVEAVVADAGTAGLKVYMEDADAPATVARVLERIAGDDGAGNDAQAGGRRRRGGRGPLALCLMAADFPEGLREVELVVPDACPASPQVKGALKSLPGVVTVEEY